MCCLPRPALFRAAGCPGLQNCRRRCGEGGGDRAAGADPTPWQRASLTDNWCASGAVAAGLVVAAGAVCARLPGWPAVTPGHAAPRSPGHPPSPCPGRQNRGAASHPWPAGRGQGTAGGRHGGQGTLTGAMGVQGKTWADSASSCWQGRSQAHLGSTSPAAEPFAVSQALLAAALVASCPACNKQQAPAPPPPPPKAMLLRSLHTATLHTAWG